jgi:two-component system cell cycle sensor histidine kinase/response regulator CckA
MSAGPTFDDIFAVMSAASVGDTGARVILPDDLDVEDPAAKLAVALNLLLDDLALRTDELKETEQQLRQAQKIEAIGRLAGGVAHDFNNLLTAIVGYAGLLKDTTPTSEQVAMITQIEGACERAAALTRQLLAFGRRQIMAPKVLEPGQVIAGIVPLIDRIIGENIELRVIAAPNGLRVRVDPTQLEQVLVNLIANARDAMPTGGVLTVEVAGLDLDVMYAETHPEVIPGRYVMLAISDTGGGMSDEVREHIFEPFFTTKDSEGGTGLGLATVYGIVKQSGGSINVYSEPGRGSVFKVYLPQVREAVEPREVVAEAPSSLTGGETILVAEDDGAVRALTVIALSRAGYNVLEADGGPMALDLASRFDGRIDLLVSDIVMRGMSGRQLATELQRLRPAVRTLFVSGYTENTIVHHGVLDAAVEFLAKPFTPMTLTQKVRQILDRKTDRSTISP